MLVYLIPVAAVGLALYGMGRVLLTTPPSDEILDEGEPAVEVDGPLGADEEAGGADADATAVGERAVLSARGG